jgi:hypothetical protein
MRDGEKIAVGASVVAAIWLGWAFWQNRAGQNSAGGLFGDLANAITGAEGVNPAYNNPLALANSSAPGVTGTINSAGVNTFDTLADGLSAGIANLQASWAAHPLLTLNQWIARYITGNPNATDSTNPGANISAYQNEVSGALGVSGDDTLAAIEGDEED